MECSTKTLARVAIIASSYLLLGFSFQSLSFGPIQVRMSDVLYPMIAVFGYPMLVGTFLGHLFFNIYGYVSGLALGVLDLFSPFIFLVPKYAILKWKLKAVPLHVIFVAFWVAYMLRSMYGLPFWISVLTVGLGEATAEIILGVPLAIAVRRRIRK